MKKIILILLLIPLTMSCERDDTTLEPVIDMYTHKYYPPSDSIPIPVVTDTIHFINQ